MKLIIAALAALSLAGCSYNIKEDQPVVVKHTETLITIPDSMFEIPDPIALIDPTKINDKIFAIWLLSKEARAIEIEKRLKAIKEYQDKKKAEQEAAQKLTEPTK